MKRVIGLGVLVLLGFGWLAFTPAEAEKEAKVTFNKGDRVVLIGNTLPERMQFFGHFEAHLHSLFPEDQLIVRNLGFSADEVRFRPRSLDFGSPDHHLSQQKADVILAFFGFNESFHGPDGLETFEKELDEFIENTLSQKYNGKSAPRLVLISPIAHENLKSPNLPDGSKTNPNIELYTAAMAKVAKKHRVSFADIYHPTKALMSTSSQPLTFNGIHLSDYGYSQLAPVLCRELFGVEADQRKITDRLVAEVKEKCFQFYHHYRAINGFYIYGGRSKRDHGNPPYTDAYVIENERAKLTEMVALRDGRIWDVAQGKSVPEKIDDSKTRKLYDVPTNFKEPVNILPPEEALKKFTIAEGYAVNLFASEVEFPNIKNPVQLTFDTKGRLWVLTMPSYPMYKPPNKPNDKLLIYEDTDGDGKADKETIFADGLHVPTGFELGHGGVFVAQQPNVVFLKDSDGDDKADVRKIVLHGFDTGDSHHSIGAFTWGPGGGLYLHEGTFHHTQVETPYGPVRNAHGGVYRYDPQKEMFETFVHYNFANPWGHVFDKWGQNFVADASGGANYFGTAFSGRNPQFTGQEDFGPFKFTYKAQMKQWFPKRVRPTAGCEFVSSRHFPPEAQGNYLLNNCIGFQGVLQHTVQEKDSGFEGTEIDPILFSSDRNFRPIDLQFGPDGALYIVDWFNPLVGHMQHSLRDPNRDKTHGRIWRITYPSRPLVTPPKIDGEPIAKLLDLLKTYEDRTRYRVREELQEFETAEVVAGIEKWVAGLDKSDANLEHHLLEALWVRQHHNAVDVDHLKRVLNSPDYHARAAATRVLCFWRYDIPNALELLVKQAHDEHPRVRLETVRACSYFDDSQAAEIALSVLNHSMDYYLTYTLTETMRTLEPFWKSAIASGKPFAADNPAGLRFVVGKLETPELITAARSAPIFEELLGRAGVKKEYRLESLTGLSKSNNTNELTELLTAIQRLDSGQQGGANADIVLYDLAHILTEREASELSRSRSKFSDLSKKSKKSITRQIGYVAMIVADQSVKQTWGQASSSVRGLQDLLDATPVIPDAQLRGALYPLVKPLLSGLPKALSKKLNVTKGRSGQYVRIELPGKRKTITLAEVEVFSGGVNVARTGTAKQSSTAFNGVAQRAIDGNNSGEFTRNGSTHTAGSDRNAFWEVDLGSEQTIDSVVIWNRTDADLGKRLAGFKLTVLDKNRKAVFNKANNPAPPKSVRFSLNPDPTPVVRRAAINAITYFDGHEQEVFKTLSGFVQKGDQRAASVRALSRLPKRTWPKEEIPPLVESLVNYAKKVPPKQRALPEVREALQLGNELASLLPADQAKLIRQAIGDLGVRVVLIRPVPHRMRFDKSIIVVAAGKPIELVLDNTDIMPHNLIITKPGKMLEVAQAAERMATQADAFAKHFIPDSPHILYASKMLQSRQIERLTFIAPKEEGEYPYVCTFPGHWRTMSGKMIVVKDVEAYLAKNPIPEPIQIAEPRPFVRDWKFDDLTSALSKLDSGRSFNRSFNNGKKLFTEIACIACHRMNEIGGSAGPDLAKLEDKVKLEDILRSMTEPSKEIKEKYQSYVIVTDDGKQTIGMVLENTDKFVKVMPNPLGMVKCEPIVLQKEAIEFMKKSKISLMPEGLLKTMSKDEILDLIAYIESRGNPKHAFYQK